MSEANLKNWKGASTTMRIPNKSLFLAIVTTLMFSAFLHADDRAELKQTVKWSVFHEGCRVYASNDLIGNITDIRNCVYQTQQHNQRALDLVGNANDDLLLQVVAESSAEIPGEFQLREAFSWVMYHEGQKEQMRTMLGRGNFEGIRSVYHDKQDHNPNARNLLAAVNNQYIRDLVNSL
jgi:hypothetical protein